MEESSRKKLKRRRLLPDLETMSSQRKSENDVIQSVKVKTDEIRRLELAGLSANGLDGIVDEVKMLWLMAKYGVVLCLKVVLAIGSIPASLTEEQAKKYVFGCLVDQGSSVYSRENVLAVYTFLNSNCRNGTVQDEISSCVAVKKEVIAPPLDSCTNCGRRLVSYLTTSVRLYTGTGLKRLDKVALQCKECSLKFSSTQFGNKHDLGYQFYPHQQETIEVSDTVHFHRSLLEWQCCLANHSWVSFQGFAEAYNDTFQLNKEEALSPKIVAAAFWRGEVENELRRVNMIEFKFKDDSDYEKCMQVLDELRRGSIYPHPECTTDCKKRGCGKLWVTDGIWKINFSHCMYQVQHTVANIPALHLPDVCTNSPAYGQAFCNEHCEFLKNNAPEVPTGLRAFLQYSGALKDDSEDLDRADPSIVDAAAAALPTSNSIGATAANSQGTTELVSNPQLVPAATLTNDSQQLCRKDTGSRKLRKWSRGHQFIVRGGGHIDSWQPLYKSESPSQVFYIILQWLLSSVQNMDTADALPEIILAYDNMCNLAKLKAAKTPLPFPAPLDQIWQHITKVIDNFHLKNHVNEQCRKDFSPAPIKEKYPEMNTQVGEQTFSWLHRFKNVLCAMPKIHHLFYLHRMVVRRNTYTAKCYKLGMKPILPKK